MFLRIYNANNQGFIAGFIIFLYLCYRQCYLTY